MNSIAQPIEIKMWLLESLNYVSVLSLKKKEITQTNQKNILQMIEVGACMMRFGNSSTQCFYYIKKSNY